MFKPFQSYICKPVHSRIPKRLTSPVGDKVEFVQCAELNLYPIIPDYAHLQTTKAKTVPI
ncbi:hypothetical protein N474_06755 [Pseudoalteromonas luteoviolacea CPMOR-2]|uniref:Uncharacterized protein n=1 Tax=Pseudoalteromonas luteoviolacea DSM 6061 TaxID=1365250 RepID=A0A166WGD6_9GAMM|nr:hypothetical protein N475_16840 [Pseudoalteromonas luteoviolacea DSM 6061]KZN59387.1 hypothetical protein N474_06755 [Pseudoalteromonas luteoviolacea CPMOR-2]